MQRFVLDRIYIAFLLILVVSFVFLIYFISYFTRRSLMQEKQDTLTNEANLIASQAVSSYESGDISKEELTQYLSYYATALNADIWYMSSEGSLIAYSDSAKYFSNASSTDASSVMQEKKAPPASIYDLDKNYKLKKESYRSGKFYGVFSNQMLSINAPLYASTVDEKGQPHRTYIGTLIMHTPLEEIGDTMKNYYTVSFMPCLVIIAISFIFLAIISRKVVRPIKKLSGVAEEYSKGNFDVETGIHTEDEFGQLAGSMEYMAGELQKLDEYRRDFVSNISHDFRSPLTSITGYVQAMQDGTIPPENQQKYLGIVLNETKRLTKLTNGLLDLNNLESYGPYLKLSTFDFIDIIKPTLNTFEMKCIDKNVAIYLNNHAEKTMVTADKTKIQQVVYNLIDNALKFTPAGKKIYVTINEKNDKLIVSIKDEGIGMDEDTQKKIWTRFYKGDTSRGKDKGGTGLGLSITKEIIKAHNENIEVFSHMGQGSEFVFTLPKAPEHGKDASGTDSLSHSGNTTSGLVHSGNTGGLTHSENTSGLTQEENSKSAE